MLITDKDGTEGYVDDMRSGKNNVLVSRNYIYKQNKIVFTL